MSKGTQSPGDLARSIRTKKFEAMKERDRFNKEDELEQLRVENDKLKVYCKSLESILATTEAALVRMSTRGTFAKQAATAAPTYPPAKTGTKKSTPLMPPKPKTNGGLFDSPASDPT
jgi:hypothetical protein